MTQKVRQITISNATRQKVQAAKSYIEQRYSKLLQQQRQKREYWDQLNKKMSSLQLSNTEQNQIKKKIIHEQAQILRQQRTKITIMDFTPLKIIGKGAFGEVRLCKWNKNGDPVAIKKLKKCQMIFKNKVIQSREERNVLAVSEKNHWIVGLKCSFQDYQNLYLVMQYLPGGDLMNLLMKKDIFTHEQAQFYTAQILMALDSVHKMKYIHRDLKPDNVLLDATGHIKLSDFGLCKHTQIRPKKLTDNLMKKQTESVLRKSQKDKKTSDQFIKEYHKKNTRKLAFSAVGTPDYVAPEVQGRVGYNQTVDWWSMGVILYQMLVGYPPFASEQPRQTWHKIQNWRKYLVIPKDAQVSPQAADLIRKLISDPKDRLGSNGVQQIKQHPFFAGIIWSKLRDRKAPYIPEVRGSWDTRNFDPYEQQEPWYPVDQSKKKPKKKNTQFIGYTYKPIEQPNSALLKALLDLESNKIPQMNNSNNLDYLALQRQLDDYQISSLNNRFKKDKTQRINKEFYATTALFGLKTGPKFQQRQKQKYKCYFNQPGQKKIVGQQILTSTSANSSNSQKVSSIKKQSPATKYEKQKQPGIRDEKKMKVKILQKKLA